MKVFYSPGYDLSCFGLEKLHAFDSCKYGHAWRLLEAEFGARLDVCHGHIDGPVSREALLRVHSADYLDRLTSSKYVAMALELPFLANVPYPLLENRVLRPMRLATQGTILAAQAAMSGLHPITVNLSGGYHHARHDQGEGFCLFNDIYVAIEALREAEVLHRFRDRILYIDLDAHQGNGVERLSEGDDAIRIFDLYNRDIYPWDSQARHFVHYEATVAADTGDVEYMEILRNMLPGILDGNDFKLAFYNAGTDVFVGDKLGGLALTSDGIYERDWLVLDSLFERGIPCVMLPSGGYSPESHRLIANTVIGLVNRHLAN